MGGRTPPLKCEEGYKIHDPNNTYTRRFSIVSSSIFSLFFVSYHFLEYMMFSMTIFEESHDFLPEIHISILIQLENDLHKQN